MTPSYSASVKRGGFVFEVHLRRRLVRFLTPGVAQLSRRKRGPCEPGAGRVTLTRAGRYEKNTMAKGEQRLEEALARTEADIDVALRSAASAVRALKRLRGFVKKGDLREIRKALEASMQAAEAFATQAAQVRQGWDFDEDAYFGGRAYVDELLATAARMGFPLTELDDRLYCYPLLVRVLTRDRVVMIDRVRERSLRPTVVIARLQALQKRPVRFAPEVFLGTLYKAYKILAKVRGRDGPSHGTVIPLSDVHLLLTLLPGSSRDYSRQEFGRDLYLLDQSGIVRTRDGAVLSFHGSTGTRSAQQTIRIIGRDGREKKYYGIAFCRPTEE
jgi:hypothetical protein